MGNVPIEPEDPWNTSNSDHVHPHLFTLIQQRLGLLPNFFQLTSDRPEIAESLWSFARFAYLDNPLPSLFKERLFVFLSRFCEARYSVTRHLGFLVGLGRPAGDPGAATQSVDEALRLLRSSLPRGAEADRFIDRCASLESPLDEMPASESEMEAAIFVCAAHAFLQTADADRSLTALKQALGEQIEHLMVFLTFVQSDHFWTKTHPKLEFEDDVKQLMAANPTLADHLLNTPELATCQNDELMHIESEERFRAIADYTYDWESWIGTDGKPKWINSAVQRIAGVSVEHCLRMDDYPLPLIHPDDREFMRARHAEALAGTSGNDVTFRILRPDGTVVWGAKSWQSITAADGTPLGYRSSIRDITDRKRSEEALLANQHRLELGSLVGGLALMEIDYTSGQSHLSAEAARLFGLGEQACSFPREVVHDTFHPDDREILMQSIAASLDPAGDGWFAMDHRVVRPSDGCIAWLRIRKQILFDGEGDTRRPVRAMLAAIDITLERNSEHSVRQSEMFIRSVLNSLPEHIAVLDADGAILAVNEPWKQFAWANGGLERAAMPIGVNYLDIFRVNSALDDDYAREAFTQINDLLAGRTETCSVEYPCDSPEQARWFLMCGRRANDGVGHVVISHIDITATKQAETRLRESEERLRRAARAARFGTYEFDFATGCNFWSAELKQLAGVPDDGEAVSIEQVIALVHPDDRDRLQQLMQQSFDPHGSGDFQDELRLVRPDGSICWVFAKGTTVFEGQGDQRRAARASGIALDITERKRSDRRVRESERHLRDVLNSLTAFVGVMTPEGTLVQANEAALKAAGKTPEDVLGKPFEETFWWSYSPEVQAQLREAISLARTGQASRYDVKVRVADDNLIDLDFMLHPMIDEEGRVTHLIPSAIEITDRKQAERALLETDRRKNEFLATLAHELRNPLATIRSGLEVIKLTHDNPKLVAETREMMERQFSHLVALVDDLLEVSRISQGKLKLRSEIVSVTDFIYSAVETCRPLIVEQGHSLSIDVPPQPIYVAGDSHRLVQLFANLINNAAKYTPRGGRIEVSAQPDGDEIVLVVKDSGIGIATDQISRVFELFAQVQKESSNYTGLGIGLSLVKSLVELHGGTITADSDGHGTGSKFTVRLPMTGCKAEVNDGKVHTTITKTSAKRRILVVDDNLGAAKLLSIVVKALGHEVQTASNGQEAIERGRAFEPGIVIMDIGMPVMDGYEAARVIRSEPWGREILLIALTGWGQDDDKQKTREAGFNRHLVKPVEPDMIRKILAEL